MRLNPAVKRALLQGCHMLSLVLEELGIRAAALHSHKAQKARLAALDRFKVRQGSAAVRRGRARMPCRTWRPQGRATAPDWLKMQKARCQVALLSVPGERALQSSAALPGAVTLHPASLATVLRAAACPSCLPLTWQAGAWTSPLWTS